VGKKREREKETEGERERSELLVSQLRARRYVSRSKMRTNKGRWELTVNEPKDEHGDGIGHRPKHLARRRTPHPNREFPPNHRLPHCSLESERSSESSTRGRSGFGGEVVLFGGWSERASLHSGETTATLKEDGSEVEEGEERADGCDHVPVIEDKGVLIYFRGA